MLAEPRLRPLRFLPTRVLRWIDIDPDSDHLLWTACVTTQGYPRVSRNGGLVMLARWILEGTVGPPPEPGYTASHKCHDRELNCPAALPNYCFHRLCCEPEHLMWETHRDNIMSSARTQAAINASKPRVTRPYRPPLSIAQEDSDLALNEYYAENL